MMSKKALLNAKVYRYFSDTFEVLNLLLINGRLVGTGYIPDDDDSEEIDLAGCWIIPDATLLLPHGCSNINLINELPFTSFCLPCSSEDEIKKYEPYTIYPFFDYSQSKEKETHPQHYFGFSNISSENSDDHEVIFNLAKNSEKPIIITDEGYELDYVLTQQKQYHFSIHICCSSLRTISHISAMPNVTFSIDLSLIHIEEVDIFVQLASFRGFSLSSFTHHLDVHALLNRFAEIELSRYMVKKPFSLLKTTPPQLKINKEPTFIVVNPKKVPSIQLQIVKGIIQ